LYDVPRQGWRLACGDKCLIKHGVNSAECILVDISISGILVSFLDNFAENIHPGDVCKIYLRGDPLTCPSEIVCTVVRKDSDRIGLQFPLGD
jgi:hypothetical protein